MLEHRDHFRALAEKVAKREPIHINTGGDIEIETGQNIPLRSKDSTDKPPKTDEAK